MNNKIISAVFTVSCIALCAVPSVGMIFAPSNEALGNEQQTTLPAAAKEDGTFNEEYLSQLGDYFSTHYAFRPQIMSADAEIQANVFGTSNLPSVTVGKNNRLYYSSTLDNYLGRNLMSPRAIFNTTHNLELTEKYLNQNNIKFLFTVAPNKNTLYPDNMPYYYGIKESSGRNLNSFVNSLNNDKLNYCDLLTVLKNSDEELYLEQDSHWNNKGALLAYNCILDSLDKPHDDYSGSKAVRVKNFYGDLGKMLYPSSQQPEYNYEYDIAQNYSYVTPTKSVEDAMILTKNEKAQGSLYMYRDSFGNALLPYFANAYGTAYFTKAFPINLALETGINQSDTVIFEIVERNLAWFAQSPPVFPATETELPSTEKANDIKWDLNAEVSSVNMQYVSIAGNVDSKLCRDDSEFTIIIKDKDGTARAFEAFTTSDESTDFGFQAYIPSEYLNGDKTEASLIIKNGSKYFAAEYKTTDIKQAEF